MDKPLLEFFHFAARVQITGHFEPAGPWDYNVDKVWQTQKIVSYKIVDHFTGNPVGWFYEDYAETSCETGFGDGEEWMVATVADRSGADHASYCIGATYLRSSGGELIDRNLVAKGLYAAFLKVCGGTLPSG